MEYVPCFVGSMEVGFEPVLDDLRHEDEQQDDRRVEDVEQGSPAKKLEERDHRGPELGLQVQGDQDGLITQVKC